MLKNYFKVAFRNLRRNKGYAFINIAGLAVGMACFLLIALYVQHEFSYDQYHEKKDQIYRVAEYSGLNEKDWNAYTTGLISTELKKSHGGILDAARIDARGPSIVQQRNTYFEDIESLYADPSFFNIFSFSFLQGNPETALSRPQSVVLTQSLAQKIFGKENPMGKVLSFPEDGNGEGSFEVTGVVEDIPSNSHFTFELLISLETRLENDASAASGSMWNYLLLRKGQSASEIEEDIFTFITENVGDPFVEEIKLEPLTTIHFSDIPAPRQSDIRYVYILAAIAAIILLIACANYMNLAIARSAGRSREVGVRKVVGAHRSQLIRQFLGESLLFALIALPLALALVELGIPLFNDLAGIQLSLSLHEDATFLLIVAGALLLIGFLAGGYPALFLSHLEPVDVLRDTLHVRLSSGRLRKALIVFQFAASVALIASTIVILNQLQYMQAKNLGFQEENLVVLPFGKEVLSNRKDAIENELLQHPDIVGVSASSGTPWAFKTQYVFRPRDTPADKKVTMNMIFGDSKYVETLGLELIAGRSFSSKRTADSTKAVLLNEAAAQELGGRSVIGKEIDYAESQRRVIGIVKDFHFESMRNEIEPVLIGMTNYPDNYPYNQLIVRLQRGDISSTMDFIEAQWEQFVPERPFTYTFLDEYFDAMYRSEQRLAKVFGLFAGLAIFLSCLGLFGLAAYMAERRTKEIGIRKVLGASLTSIVTLLSKDFAKLVLMAFIVAAPLAWYGMTRWLEDFAYHIELEPWVFVGAGLLAFVIALATVSYHALRTALSDPVDALRYE